MNSHEKFAAFKAEVSAKMNAEKITAAEASKMLDIEAKKHGYNRAAVSFRLSTGGVYTVV